MKTLTAQQQKIYDFIVSYQAEYGFPPSVREIAGAVGLKSPSTVHFHLKALEEAGAISRGTGKTRAITATGSAQHINEVPLLGSVAAGAPILAEECVEEYLPFDTAGRSGDGEIVIALIGDDATCKRLDRRSGHTWLLPENDDYEPIDGSEAVILGKVVGLIRRY